MPGWSSYSFLFGPLLIGGVVAGLVLVLRWGFGHGGSLVRPVGSPGSPADYGLLVPVDAPRTYESGLALQEELRGIGVESTLARTTAGLRVLVWPRHADAARAVARRRHDAA